MALKNDREYRLVVNPDMVFRAVEDEQPAEGQEERYEVEGYATTFNDPYGLWEDEDGNQYKETIDRDAFDGADMSDVIFLYNHEGMVYARMSNGTLMVSPNERGLYIRADLGSTQASREMFESIKAGLVTQMSWAFTVADDDFDGETLTRTIKRVKKVYDVSAVSIPANPNTDIAARSSEGVIAELKHRRECELQLAEERAKVRELLRR